MIREPVLPSFITGSPSFLWEAAAARVPLATVTSTSYSARDLQWVTAVISILSSHCFWSAERWGGNEIERGRRGHITISTVTTLMSLDYFPLSWVCPDALMRWAFLQMWRPLLYCDRSCILHLLSILQQPMCDDDVTFFFSIIISWSFVVICHFFHTSDTSDFYVSPSSSFFFKLKQQLKTSRSDPMPSTSTPTRPRPSATTAGRCYGASSARGSNVKVRLEHPPPP